MDLAPDSEKANSEPTVSRSADTIVSADIQLPFDPLRLAAAVLRRWYWLCISSMVLFALGIGISVAVFKISYTSEIQLIRRGTDSGFRATQFGDAFKPGELKVETLEPLMHSVNLLSKVASQATPPITAKQLSGALAVTPERRTELIRVAFSTKVSAEESARIVNLYGHAVVQLTKDLQQQEAEETSAFLQDELGNLSRQLDIVNNEILQFSRDETYIDGDKETEAYLRDLGNMELNLQEARIEDQSINMRINNLRDALRKHNPVATELRSAQEKLTGLLVQYTEKNPLVIEQQNHIDKLKQQLETYDSPDTDDAAFTGAQLSDAIYLDLVKLKANADSLVNRITSWESMRNKLQAKLERIPGKNLSHARLQARKSTLEETRNLITARQTEAQVYQKNALGYYRLFTETTAASALISGTGKKTATLGIALGGLGFAGMLFLILLLELSNKQIITGKDVSRATGLPLLGKLEATTPLEGKEIEHWALKQYAKLVEFLHLSPSEYQEIGFLSAIPDEGKSTIIHALGHSVSQRGRKVLAIVNSAPSGDPSCLKIDEILQSPDLVKKSFEGTSQDQKLWLKVACPPQFDWTLEKRNAWEKARRTWNELQDLTLLVELHSDLSTNSIMFAENLRHLIWISSSGTQTTREVDAIISVLEHTNCRLKGALINREPNLFASIPFLGRFVRPSLGMLLLAATMLAPIQIKAAAPTKEQAVPSNENHSGRQEHQAAAWQQRLTLGPGDTVDIGLYGYQNHLRKNVIVSPDGKISYLQARNVTAKGLTIDELRAALDTRLRDYFRAPRTMIMPREFRSKRFHIMGSVKRSGSYIMNRPITVIEAVAQAEGMRTGLFDHNTIELADLGRSFIVRGSKRMNVDFKKLFHQGDLSQNILLEPDDYIYIPNSSANEVYLLGAVMRPGAIGITTDATVIRLITVRSGFLKTAYKDKLLIIRGSWVEPKTFIFDAAAVLQGKAKDFLLEPKDVVFVSEHPWTKVTELLDLAARTFLQSATATWTGENIGPLITQPLIQ